VRSRSENVDIGRYWAGATDLTNLSGAPQVTFNDAARSQNSGRMFGLMSIELMSARPRGPQATSVGYWQDVRME
jgi:hypothetical protein